MPVVLPVLQLPCGIETKTGRLLCVLLLWIDSLPADPATRLMEALIVSLKQVRRDLRHHRTDQVGVAVRCEHGGISRCSRHFQLQQTILFVQT